jgi:hypothetical protein
MAPVDASRLFATFYVGNPVFGNQATALAASSETGLNEQEEEST